MNSPGNFLREHDGFYHMGRLVRSHGVKGNVIAKLDVDEPGIYKSLRHLFLDQEGQLKEYKVQVLSVLNDHITLHLDGIDDMDIAAGLAGTELFLPLSELPPLKGKRVYLHEAKGMKVIDMLTGELGIVEKIFELPEQPLVSLTYKEKEILFPLISDFIDHIDRKENTIYIRLPEGLLDIYLNS